MNASKAKGKKPEQSSEELKASIIKVALKHFAMHGFNGASLKDIAAEADVAGSLINYHFTDKAGLFQAAIKPFAVGRLEAISRLMSPAKNRDELKLRIQLFVEEMQSSFLADLHSFEIIDRELRAENPLALKIFEETMLQTFKFVVGFFKKAQEDELVAGDRDPVILASILFTSTCDAVRKEFIAKRFFNITFTNPDYRQKFAEHIAEIFMNGVAK
jgi:AcrR family transcriptional regulator